jgi:glycosyltransferase involved in cell wall biosynthesis
MKICLINNLYKPYNRGGAEQIVKLQAEGLIEAGHEIFIITTKPVFAKRTTSKAQQKIYYLSGLYYNLEKIPKIIRYLWHLIDIFDISNYLKIKSILEKEKPEAVITHNLKGVGYLTPRAIKSLKIKHIHILHDIQLVHPSGLMFCGKEKRVEHVFAKTYTAICRRLFDSPDTILSPSAWLMKIHTDKNFFHDSKKIILPNPATTSSKENKINKEKKGPFRFLYVGQIEKHKGILFLIKSFSILCQDSGRCGFELIIIGTGSKLGKAKQLAGPNKYIKFLGQKQKEEIEDLMKLSDCLVVPSLCYENSPAVIYEAATAGLAGIATRLGGIPELIHELGGILFKAGNEGDLMHQMKWAMDNPEALEKIGNKSQKKIKKFSLENYTKKLLLIFK